MNERTFLIALDSADPTLDQAAVKTLIRSDPDFLAWWNHLPSIFLVTTRLNEDQISERLKRVTQGATFLVVEVNPVRSEGWLPERAWRWIRRRSGETSDATDNRLAG